MVSATPPLHATGHDVSRNSMTHATGGRGGANQLGRSGPVRTEGRTGRRASARAAVPGPAARRPPRRGGGRAPLDRNRPDVGRVDDGAPWFHRLFFFQAEDGIRDTSVTGVQTCALPIFISCGALIEW